MKPIFTEPQIAAGQDIARRVLDTLSAAKTPLPDSLAGLLTATVVAADLMDAPLESVFQAMRIMRKAMQHAQKQLDDARARGEAPSLESGLVAPDGARLIVP